MDTESDKLKRVALVSWEVFKRMIKEGFGFKEWHCIV